jgi:hypothetical protein
MTALENISLYIPHVFPNFNKEFLTEQFEQLGDIDHIDMISKLDKAGKPYNSVYIHFNRWYTDIEARNFHANVLDPRTDAHFYYDKLWYWLVLPNTAKKQISGNRKQKLDLDGANSICVEMPDGPLPLIRSTNADGLLILKHLTNTGCLKRATDPDGPLPLIRSTNADGPLPLIRSTNACGVKRSTNSGCLKRATDPDGPLPLIRSTNADGPLPLTRSTNADGIENLIQFAHDPLFVNAPAKSTPMSDEEFNAFVENIKDEINMDEIEKYLTKEEEPKEELPQEIFNDMDEILNNMDEIDDMMEIEDDIYMSNYDSRYVYSLEQENLYLNSKLDFIKTLLSCQQESLNGLNQW